MDDYLNKPSDYFYHARTDIISLIPTNDSYSNLLEIGAGGGATLIEIKKRNLVKNVFGVELMELERSYQKDDRINQFIIGNIEHIELPFQNDMFDIILCGDVLEHLHDPWVVLANLSQKLKKGGILIASIPNIRVKSALIKIVIKGDFGYTKDGTFDKTHLRFFCKKNMIDMLTQSGFEITHMRRNFDFTPFSKGKIFDTITFGLFEEFLALQYLFVVKKV